MRLFWTNLVAIGVSVEFPLETYCNAAQSLSQVSTKRRIRAHDPALVFEEQVESPEATQIQPVLGSETAPIRFAQ